MGALDESRKAQVSAVAALDEPTRRRLYDFVVRQPGPVSRDEVAEALHMPKANAAFHLERLVVEGLLDIGYERRTGRSGPGAGRPSKLYHRSAQQVAVTIPERRYEIAGQLLAGALRESQDTGEPPEAVLNRRARRLGRKLGEAAGGDEDTREALLLTLEAHGFEPRAGGTAITLGNCPFHTLAQEHTDLVCGMNLCLLDGLLDGLAATGLSARLDPTPGHCCVRIAPAADP